jgi:hypothetical protein
MNSIPKEVLKQGGERTRCGEVIAAVVGGGHVERPVARPPGGTERPVAGERQMHAPPLTDLNRPRPAAALVV